MREKEPHKPQKEISMGHSGSLKGLTTAGPTLRTKQGPLTGTQPSPALQLCSLLWLVLAVTPPLNASLGLAYFLDQTGRWPEEDKRVLHGLEGRFGSHLRRSCTSTSVQSPGTWRRPLWCRCCWWRLRGTGGSESRARCCCCRPGNGGWKGGCVPAQGWGLGVLARLSGASCGGSGGSVESAFQRILLSAPPVRSPPLPSPPLSSPARDSLFNLPFALVSPVSGGSGGNGTGPTILQALLPMGPRIGLTDLAIKIQDAG